MVRKGEQEIVQRGSEEGGMVARKEKHRVSEMEGMIKVTIIVKQTKEREREKGGKGRR